VKSPYTYVVGAGDVLAIEVFDEPKLSHEVAVAPDGRITLPLLGQIEVTDRTLPQIADLVAARLVETETIPDPALAKVSVTLKESRSAQVQVWGEVGRQGAIPYRDRLSVVEAIGAVGGPHWGTANTEDVRIVRGALDDPLLIAVDLDNVLLAADKDVFLEPGDIVVVPEKWVTRFDRYLQQLLSPIRNVVGAGQQAAGLAVSPIAR
jgi:polysaccharide export outer membrane protein